MDQGGQIRTELDKVFLPRASRAKPRELLTDWVDPSTRLGAGLGNFLRRLALPKPVKDWSLRTLRDKLIKIGAKAVSHSRYVIFQMVGVAVPQQNSPQRTLRPPRKNQD
jgi:hypothetical protein